MKSLLNCLLCGNLSRSTYTLIFGLVLGYGFANILLLQNAPTTNIECSTTLSEGTRAVEAFPLTTENGPNVIQPVVSTVKAIPIPESLNASRFLDDVKKCLLSRSDICVAQRARIFCWVFTTAQNLANRASFVNRTWLSKCDGHAFFVGNSNPKDLETPVARSMRIVHLESVKESRDTLFDKTRKSLEWIVGTEWPLNGQVDQSSKRPLVDSFDWFFKADDDTFAVIENMKLMLADKNPNEAMYFGRHFKKHVASGYASGGAGYVLSRAAVHRFVKEGIALKQCPEQKMTDEDVELGRCFEQLKVPIRDSRDTLGRQRFHPVQPIDQFAHGKPGEWQSEYDLHPTSFGEECCADTSVTFHYVVGPQQLMLYHFVYKMLPFARRNKEHSLNVIAACIHDWLSLQAPATVLPSASSQIESYVEILPKGVSFYSLVSMVDAAC